MWWDGRSHFLTNSEDSDSGSEFSVSTAKFTFVSRNEFHCVESITRDWKFFFHRLNQILTTLRYDEASQAKKERSGNDSTSNHRIEIFECSIGSCKDTHKNKSGKSLKVMKDQVTVSEACLNCLTPRHFSSKLQCRICEKLHLCNMSQEQGEKGKEKNCEKTWKNG